MFVSKGAGRFLPAKRSPRKNRLGVVPIVFDSSLTSVKANDRARGRITDSQTGAFREMTQLLFMAMLMVDTPPAAVEVLQPRLPKVITSPKPDGGREAALPIEVRVENSPDPAFQVLSDAAVSVAVESTRPPDYTVTDIRFITLRLAVLKVSPTGDDGLGPYGIPRRPTEAPASKRQSRDADPLYSPRRYIINPAFERCS